jgi:two-component sensor histidine kinase
MSSRDRPSATRGSNLLKALANTGITVVYFNPEMDVEWCENVPRAWAASPIEGRSLHTFLPVDAAADIVLAKHEAVTSGQGRKVEICLPAEQGATWFSVWVDAYRAASGEVAGIMTTAVDITDQRRREQTLRTLLREVAHRSKNLLAIIQSIAAQTGRHSDTIDHFLSRFHGRLQSLASTQDLVTSSNWRGASLHDLVMGQVGRYTADPNTSIRLEGGKSYLDPNAALHIGLALHELAVNSVSYGALARPNGQVSIIARHTEPPPCLSITWTEAIDNPDLTVGKKRFGSVALERVVPASVNGSAELAISNDHLTYSLLVPEGHFESEP